MSDKSTMPGMLFHENNVGNIIQNHQNMNKSQGHKVSMDALQLLQ